MTEYPYPNPPQTGGVIHKQFSYEEYYYKKSWTNSK